MLRRTLFLTLFALIVACVTPAQAEDVNDLLTAMITAYSQSSKGVQDEAFLEKVKAIDEHLREKIEKDHDLAPFRTVITAAQEMKSRLAARKMFEVLLDRVFKRLQFTKAQQDITDADLKKEMDAMVASIEAYLDPNLPDDDTVDRASLETQRKRLREKIKAAHAAILSKEGEKRITVQVVSQDGGEGKLKPSREANLLAKLKTVIPDPGKMTVTVTIKRDDLHDIRVFVRDFVGPNGFSVVEGELDFVDVTAAALDDGNATELDNVLGDAHFRRYRCVQTDEQLNIMPQAGNAAYEMGTMAPGQSWKMTFKKVDGISTVMKAMEGHEEVAILNAKTAINDKALEFKNNGSRNLMYLQGTDVTGLVSVKALGYLTPKDGIVTFRDVLLVVDDGVASDLTKFVGEQGINFFLKRASENLRKGLPFTPVLENVSCERNDTGNMVYIFTGRGKNAL
ncbi:MAG TPA: hypothetical protein PKO06_04965 [Candidatus Ozemobacteraceae bacterium]|nr:hypothetical protein [Candidatus Ozemobacteraceae bacterium]